MPRPARAKPKPVVLAEQDVPSPQMDILLRHTQYGRLRRFYHSGGHKDVIVTNYGLTVEYSNAAALIGALRDVGWIEAPTVDMWTNAFAEPWHITAAGRAARTRRHDLNAAEEGV